MILLQSDDIRRPEKRRQRPPCAPKGFLRGRLTVLFLQRLSGTGHRYPPFPVLQPFLYMNLYLFAIKKTHLPDPGFVLYVREVSSFGTFPFFILGFFTPPAADA